MSVWKEIRCDAAPNPDGCLSNINQGPKGFEATAELHAEARRAGWIIRKGGEAICPVCRRQEASHGQG